MKKALTWVALLPLLSVTASAEPHSFTITSPMTGTAPVIFEDGYFDTTITFGFDGGTPPANTLPIACVTFESNGVTSSPIRRDGWRLRASGGSLLGFPSAGNVKCSFGGTGNGWDYTVTNGIVAGSRTLEVWGNTVDDNCIEAPPPTLKIVATLWKPTTPHAELARKEWTVTKLDDDNPIWRSECS